MMPKARYDLLFLMLSVLGHGALIALVAVPESALMPKPTQAITVSLMSPTPAPELVETVTEQSPPATELTEAPAQTMPPSMTDELLNESTSTAETQSTIGPAHRGAQLITRMTQQLPSLVSDLNPIKAPETSPSHRGAPAPKLPGGPSLFDAWMGPVSPQLDQWMEPGGERHARVTFSNGQIVCIQARGLTTQELFNPWMSAAIPMSRLCGRQRPEAIDLENPWLRTRPKRQD